MRIVLLIAALLWLTPSHGFATPAGFIEHTIAPGDTWERLVPDPTLRDLAKRVNRMNVELSAGAKILLPTSSAALSYVPVPTRIGSSNAREFVVYRDLQYFGAYENGRLVKWGPVSTGRGGTPTGSWTVKAKQEKKYSRRYGNSRMFFAIQYNGNYFLHEQVLPGHAASKGCVRMLWEDAEWNFGWIKKGDLVRIVRKPDDVIG